MRRNNFWNRLFHRSEVDENQRQYELYRKQMETGQDFIVALENARDLRTLWRIHKDAYGTGFVHKNLGPDRYGMFRCSNILTMTPGQVFLGGIYGLSTCAIPFWEQCRDEPFGANEFGIDENRSLYGMILDQYRHHLISNIGLMDRIARMSVPDYENNGYTL